METVCNFIFFRILFYLFYGINKCFLPYVISWVQLFLTYMIRIRIVPDKVDRDEDVMFVVGDVIALWYPSLYAVTDSYSHSFDIDLDIQEALTNAGYPEPQEEEDEWADDSSSENEQDEVDESDTDNEVNEDDTDDETYNVVDG